MGVPIELKTNADVFYYGNDSSIKDAANHLKGLLSNARIFKAKGSGSNLGSYNKEERKIAWLVGHGKSNREDIIDGYAIDSICEWLKNNEYTHVIDTCCEPNTRKTKNHHGLTYYCCSDGKTVTCIDQYVGSFDQWWDSHGF